MRTSNVRERAYLNVLLQLLRVRDAAAPFEQLLRRWFEVSRVPAGEHVRSKAIWPLPQSWPTDAGMPEVAQFVSADACRALTTESVARLLFEPAVPADVLKRLLFDLQPQRAIDLQAFLSRTFRIGLISTADRERLDAAGLAARMPEHWTPADRLFDRFHCAGITVQDATKLAWAVYGRPREPSERLLSNAPAIRFHRPYWGLSPSV